MVSRFIFAVVFPMMALQVFLSPSGIIYDDGRRHNIFLPFAAAEETSYRQRKRPARASSLPSSKKYDGRRGRGLGGIFDNIGEGEDWSTAEGIVRILRDRATERRDRLVSWMLRRWDRCSDRVIQEQRCEDYNAAWIATAPTAAAANVHRRLICMPLQEDLFDPPTGSFSHGHVQTGDKMSVPSCFWKAIQKTKADVPWLFSVTRVPGETGDRVQFVAFDRDNEEEDEQQQEEEDFGPYRPLKDLDCVVGGPLDFRAPSNYCFLPAWMMRALGVRPGDVVQVELCETVAPGTLAKLRPHSKSFSSTISNPQAVLETELRHYSSLTAGSTIAFDYNGVRYWFDVVEVRSAPRGEKVPSIKVQDCDIATEFLTSKDVLREKKKKRKQQQQKQ